MDDAKVWTVMVRVDDEIRSCDMVYIEGTPHLVWEWTEDAANEFPSRTTPLNPNHLQATPEFGEYDFVYGPDVEEPGPAS